MTLKVLKMKLVQTKFKILVHTGKNQLVNTE